MMDKIQLLRALFNDEASYDELLKRLHTYAKGQMGSEGGLPYHDTHWSHMELMVKEWLVKLILKVGD